MSVSVYDVNWDWDVEIIKFPGGEPHVKVKDNSRAIPIVDCRFQNNDDLITAFAVTDALRRKGHKEIELFIPYFPGARQDRVKSYSGEALTCKVYADLINSQNYSKVIIVDPHSDVTPALINNCRVVTQRDIFCGFKNHLLYEYYGLIAPDAGARKKTEDAADPYHLNRVYYASKKRDMATGKLSGFSCEALPSSYEFSIKKGEETRELQTQYVILDDICDGGGTFIGLAEEIRKQNKESPIDLYITHGIFSQGTDKLLKYFRKIITTDSVHIEKYSRLEPIRVINLKELLFRPGF